LLSREGHLAWFAEMETQRFSRPALTSDVYLCISWRSCCWVTPPTSVKTVAFPFETPFDQPSESHESGSNTILAGWWFGTFFSTYIIYIYTYFLYIYNIHIHIYIYLYYICIGNFIVPTDDFSIIFQRARAKNPKNHQPVLGWSKNWLAMQFVCELLKSKNQVTAYQVHAS
jgi:hypothetical protein